MWGESLLCTFKPGCFFAVLNSLQRPGAFPTTQYTQLKASHCVALQVYTYLGLAYVVISLLGEIALIAGGMIAAGQLHNKLMEKVLRLPMSFFESQPAGRRTCFCPFAGYTKGAPLTPTCIKPRCGQKGSLAGAAGNLSAI